MERMPARAQSQRAIFALDVTVTAPLVSRLLTGIKHRTTTSRCKNTNNQIPDSSVAHALTRGSCRIPRESPQVTASLPHAYPALSGFHSQAMMAPWASSRLSARSQAGSFSHHYTLGVACSVSDRNRRRSIGSARPHPRHNRPGMNDLGTWAEL